MKTVFDPALLALQIYSKLYYLVKHHLHLGNLPGFGFLSRLPRRDTILSVDGAQMFFNHLAAANYVCLLGGHFNEPETHKFIRHVLDMLSAPCGFVDVGANVGEMVVDFPRHPKITKALAFEPSTICCGIIEQNCALNGLQHVTVVNKAVGETIGQGVMPRAAHSQCSTAVEMQVTQASTVQDMFDEVEVATLDAEIPDASGSWIMLIDVEGAELKVMRGGRSFICSVRPLVIFEYHEGTRTRFSLDDVRAELGDDYELFRLRSDGFLDNDLLLTWNCVAVSRTSHFYTIAKRLTMEASRVSSSRNAMKSAAVGDCR